MGLPSDDSEDGDYDPDIANVNDDVEGESSSSDFTSASEDLVAVVHDDGSSCDDKLMVPLLGSDQDTADCLHVSGRRHVERLDYKKLYDETYGNGPSDSNDDEEWTDMIPTCKRKGAALKKVFLILQLAMLQHTWLRTIHGFQAEPPTGACSSGTAGLAAQRLTAASTLPGCCTTAHSSSSCQQQWHYRAGCTAAQGSSCLQQRHCLAGCTAAHGSSCLAACTISPGAGYNSDNIHYKKIGIL